MDGFQHAIGLYGLPNDGAARVLSIWRVAHAERAATAVPKS